MSRMVFANQLDCLETSWKNKPNILVAQQCNRFGKQNKSRKLVQRKLNSNHDYEDHYNGGHVHPAQGNATFLHVLTLGFIFEWTLLVQIDRLHCSNKLLNGLFCSKKPTCFSPSVMLGVLLTNIQILDVFWLKFWLNLICSMFLDFFKTPANSVDINPASIFSVHTLGKL